MNTTSVRKKESEQMRIKSVAIQNFRLIADSTIEVPSGLTLVNGENGLGKSSIFQAVLWCLYGPGAVGDNQPSLVRQGQRNMSVTVDFVHGLSNYTTSRQVRMSPNGKSGSTELTFKRHDPMVGSQIDGDLTVTDAQTVDRSGGTIAETQAEIDKTIGKLEIFMATAYVDQHDGPGAFLRSKPAEQRAQLRDMLNISPNWDNWFELAKLKHKNTTLKIASTQALFDANVQFLEENAEDDQRTAKATADRRSGELFTEMTKLGGNRDVLIATNKAVEEVVAENKRRQTALDDNKTSLDSAVRQQVEAYDEKDRLEKLMEDLPVLERKFETYDDLDVIWSAENERHGDRIRDYVKGSNEWGGFDTQLNALYDYYERIGNGHTFLTNKIKEYDETLESQAPTTHCPTCEQKLETEDSFTKANANRQQIADERTALVDELNSLNDRVDLGEIVETQLAHGEDKPLEPIGPGTRPVFAEKEQHAQARDASSKHTFHGESVKLIETSVNTLEVARDGLQTPDEYDSTVYADRAVEIEKLRNQISQASTDRDNCVSSATQASVMLQQINDRKTLNLEHKRTLTAQEAMLHDLDIVVTGVGPNGARQLMIDQQLADFQGECNEWLGTLLPGFSIYMDTQAESGRETFETAFTTPTGVVGWHGLSGAQRVGVGLSTRLALAGMVQARLGHTFETWIIDEADGSMRGEKREAFVAMLYKMQESGIDILVVSHADTVVERMDQRIEVIDAGGYTVIQ